MNSGRTGWESPAIVWTAVAMLLVIGVWACLDYWMKYDDARESDDIQRRIREAYQKMNRR